MVINKTNNQKYKFLKLFEPCSVSLNFARVALDQNSGVVIDWFKSRRTSYSTHPHLNRHINILSWSSCANCWKHRFTSFIYSSKIRVDFYLKRFLNHLPWGWMWMELLQVLSLLAFVFAKGRGFISKLPGFKTCTWKYCRGTEWRNDWAPSITTGKCVKQHRDAHFLYETRKENFICPPPIPCLPPTKQYRTMCELTSFMILF